MPRSWESRMKISSSPKIKRLPPRNGQIRLTWSFVPAFKRICPSTRFTLNYCDLRVDWPLWDFQRKSGYYSLSSGRWYGKAYVLFILEFPPSLVKPWLAKASALVAVWLALQLWSRRCLMWLSSTMSDLGPLVTPWRRSHKKSRTWTREKVRGLRSNPHTENSNKGWNMTWLGGCLWWW